MAMKSYKDDIVISNTSSIRGWGALCAALVIGVTAGLLTMPVLADHGDKPIQINAGSPGWDHSFPFIAEKMGFWKKYGLKVNFLYGSFSRNRQMMSIGDYDAGYTQISDIMRYIEAGLPIKIVASTTYGAATLVGAPQIKSVSGLKGNTIAVTSLRNVQYLVLVHHILPRFGLSRKNVKLLRIRAPEVAALVTLNQVQAAFPFEPYGTDAVGKGATMLLDWDQIMDKKILNEEMFRNSLSMTDRLRVKHPDLAKKVVWAHLDALAVLRKDPEQATEILASYAKRIDKKLTRAAYDKMGLAYSKIPVSWIAQLGEWMLKDKFIKRRITASEVTDYSFQKGHPAADK
ncbi:MAG: ABC transporter substrate-binding protein [Candidatus Binatia bacterium]